MEAGGAQESLPSLVRLLCLWRCCFFDLHGCCLPGVRFDFCQIPLHESAEFYTRLSEAQQAEKETRARRMNQRLEEQNSPAMVDVMLWGAPDDAPKPRLVRRPSEGRLERI